MKCLYRKNIKGRRSYIPGQRAEAEITLSIRESLRVHGDILGRILIAFEETANKGLKKSKKMLLETQGRGILIM